MTEYVVLQAFWLEEDELRRDVGTTSTVVWAPVSAVDGRVRVFKAASASAAIRQHTGDGEDIIAGTWKACPLRSWRGGETTKTKVTSLRLPLEEAIA